MLPSVPFYVHAMFAVSLLLTVYFLFSASRFSRRTMWVIGVWVALQSAISLGGFYLDTYKMPPRFIFLIGPTLLLTVGLFTTPAGRRWIDSLDVARLTLLHVVRIPVELVLYWLFVQSYVPEIMTFSGQNFDIVAGLTAPLVFYFGYRQPRLPRAAMIAWHIGCLALLANIVYLAIFSAPTPFQKYGFEQPNEAVFNFPYTLLPGLIVPVVLFSHLVALRSLLLRRV